MSDFVNKVITIILIFVMLVLAPLMISYLSTDMVTQRLILNDVTLFIDKVTDKGTVTQYDLDDLYLAVNSHGSSFNVTVDRYSLIEQQIPNPDNLEEKKTKLVYIKHDDMERLQKGELNNINLNVKDVIKVHVEEVAMSSGNRLFWSVLKVDKGKFEFSLAGTVR